MAGLSWFTPAQADFSFVHLTDPHFTASDKAGSNADKDSEIYREVSNLPSRPAFAVTTGDICETATPAEYGIYQQALQNLKIPHYAAPGNHDVRWNPLGKEGYVLGTRQPLYQSWDYENIHFVLLDSTVLLQHWAHFDQAMLDWLQADLKQAGTERPIIIGFHHWIARDSVQADNERQLLEITAPYNVVLWLQGHGHSDIQWNINGAPAIMSKGQYQGSYHLIEVTGTSLRVLKRTVENPTPTKVLFTIPLARKAAPSWNAVVRLEKDELFIGAKPGELPTGTKISYRLDTGSYVPLTNEGPNWQLTVAAKDFMAGEHLIWVRAELPDGRSYLRSFPLTVRRDGAPKPLWVTSLGGAVQSKLVRNGDALYVSIMDGGLYCLDAQTGRIQWKFGTGGAVFSTPAVADGIVYFGSADHFVYAVDAATGALKWKTETGGAVFGGAAVSRGVVCIASVDTKIYGLNALSGAVLWTVQGAGMYQSQAATNGNMFYVGGWDNMFRALEVSTGREVWKQKFGKSFYYAPAIGSPTATGGQAFVTSNDGFLHAMETETGKILWEVPGPSLGYSGPLLRNGRIFNASLTGKVFSFDAKTGAKLWEAPTGSTIYDSSCAWGETAQGGAVYVGSVNGVFSAINSLDGQLLWQYRLAPGHLLASPATDEKRVFIASQNGQVVALPLMP